MKTIPSHPNQPFKPENSGKNPLQVFISAAEASADLYGALLIDSVKKKCSDIEFLGVAGPKMRKAGCQSLFDMTKNAAMLLNAWRLAGQSMRIGRESTRLFRSGQIDAVVLIDSPALHLPLAARARHAGVPVLYYVAPQLWAWGARRIRKVRRFVDRLAVILPFEEQYFKNRGVDATYVGHPLTQVVEAEAIDIKSSTNVKNSADAKNPANAESPVDSEKAGAVSLSGQPVVALLPGSRRQVVEQVLPGQLDVARKIAEAFPSAVFGVSVANPKAGDIIRERIASYSLPITPFEDGHTALLQAADLALVASGTTTLEVAIRRCPMIVMYNSSRLLYHLVGRWLVKTPYLSLPNILAGRPIVPEFMPYYTNTTPIAEKAIALLKSPERRNQMLADLDAVVEPLKGGNASDKTAEMLLEMLSTRNVNAR